MRCAEIARSSWVGLMCSPPDTTICTWPGWGLHSLAFLIFSMILYSWASWLSIRSSVVAAALVFATVYRHKISLYCEHTNVSEPTASATHPVPCQHCPHHTQIPLSELFNYNLPDNGFDFYWKEGLKNLERQSDEFEQQHNEQNAVPGSKNNVLPVPADISSSTI